MAILQISYSDLNSTSRYASKVSSKLEGYANRLSSGVSRKISNVSGGSSSRLESALNKTNSKIKSLEEKATKMSKYSTKINTFKEKVKAKDEDVAKKITNLRNKFAKENDIKISKVEEFFQWLVVDNINKSEFGKWIKGLWDDAKDFLDNLKDNIKTWYKTGGGKYIVDTVLSIVGVVAGIVIAIGAILTGGALIFVIAGVISGVILAINNLSDIKNDIVAYKKHKEGSELESRVFGNLDTASESIKHNWDKKYHFVATIMDGAELVTDVILIGKSIGEFYKLFTKPRTGFKSLKQLFGSNNNNRSVGIVGSRFTESVNGTRKFTFGSLTNGFKSLFTDKAFKNQIGKSIKLFGSELVDKFKYSKSVFMQGTDLVKNSIFGDIQSKQRSFNLLKSAISSNLNNFKNRSIGILAKKVSVKDGLGDALKKTSSLESMCSFREFVTPKLDKLMSIIEDIQDLNKEESKS